MRGAIMDLVPPKWDLRMELPLCLYIPNSSGNLNDVQAIYGKIAHMDSSRIPYFALLWLSETWVLMFQNKSRNAIFCHHSIKFLLPELKASV